MQHALSDIRAAVHIKRGCKSCGLENPSEAVSGFARLAFLHCCFEPANKKFNVIAL
ncbi:MAG: hypothetical protein ACK5JT_03565 [Hyphomicrobiaceae bacterium]